MESEVSNSFAVSSSGKEADTNENISSGKSLDTLQTINSTPDPVSTLCKPGQEILYEETNSFAVSSDKEINSEENGSEDKSIGTLPSYGKAIKAITEPVSTLCKEQDDTRMYESILSQGQGLNMEDQTILYKEQDHTLEGQPTLCKEQDQTKEEESIQVYFILILNFNYC